VVDGTVQVEVGPRDIRFTPAERAMGRATVPRVRFPGYPIPVLEDTTFVGTNFAQEAPHTAVVFAIAPGVRVVFESDLDSGPCNLLNVTIPDEVAPEDIGNVQNAQTVQVATGNPDRPYIPCHAEDEATATFTAALLEEIASGRWATHHRLGLVKAAARARRRDVAVKAADLAALVASNEVERAKIRDAVASAAVVE